MYRYRYTRTKHNLPKVRNPYFKPNPVHIDCLHSKGMNASQIRWYFGAPTDPDYRNTDLWALIFMSQNIGDQFVSRRRGTKAAHQESQHLVVQ